MNKKPRRCASCKTMKWNNFSAINPNKLREYLSHAPEPAKLAADEWKRITAADSPRETTIDRSYSQE